MDSHSVVFDGFFDRMFCCSYTNHQLGDESSIVDYSNSEDIVDRELNRVSLPMARTGNMQMPPERQQQTNTYGSSGGQYNQTTCDTTTIGMERHYQRQQQRKDHIDNMVFVDPREPLPVSSSSMSYHQMEHNETVTSPISSSSSSQHSIYTVSTAPCSSNGSFEINKSSSSSSCNTGASGSIISICSNTSGDDEETAGYRALNDSSLTFGSTSSASSVATVREAFHSSQNKHDCSRRHIKNDSKNNRGGRKKHGSRVGMSTAAALEAAKARSRHLRETRDKHQKRCHTTIRDGSSCSKCSSSKYKHPVPLGELPHDIRRIQSESLSELRLLSQADGYQC
jgi:hypothetical protein